MTSLLKSAYRALVGKRLADIYEAAESGDLNYLDRHVSDICATDHDGNTILHKAARSGQTKVVKWAIEKHSQDLKRCLEIKAADSATALHLAAIVGDAILIGVLLDASEEEGIDAASSRALVTPLHLAAYVGSSAAVKVLVARGANPLALTNQKETPLHIAAARTISSVPAGHDHDAVVEELLKDSRVKRLVKEGIASTSGYSPLLYACYGGFETCADLLIDADAPLTKFTIKHRLPLHAAAINGHFSVVKKLLKPPRGKQAAIKPTNAKKNALFFAAESGSVEMMNLFLETMIGLGFDPETELDASLIEATAKFGHVEVAKILLSYNAPINTDDGKTHPLKHPLTIAALKGHKDVFFEIIKTYPALPLFQDKAAFLHIAVEGGSLDIVKHILEAEPDLLDPSQKGESSTGANRSASALDIAAKHGHLELVKFFLDKKVEFDTGLNVGFYIAAKNGYSDIVEEGLKKVAAGGWLWSSVYPGVDMPQFKFQVLCGAADGGQDDLVKVLLDRYKAPLVNASGEESALHTAASRGRVSTVAYLLKRGDAKLGKRRFNVLHTAVYNGQKEVVEFLLKQKFDIEERSGTVNDPAGGTPLHIAVDRTTSAYRYHYLSTVKFLLDKNADVNAKINGNENTALHLAALSSNRELAEVLLQNGADINAINAKMETPLHLAAGTKSTPLRVFNVLLESTNEATLLMENAEGQTPVMLAKAAKKPLTVKLLEARGAAKAADSSTTVVASDTKTEEGESSDFKRQKLDEEPLGAEESLKKKSFYDDNDFSSDPDIKDTDWLEATSQLENRLKRLLSYPKNEGKKEISKLEADDQIACYLGNMQGLKDYMIECNMQTIKSADALRTIREHPEWWQDGKLGRWLNSIGTNLTGGSFHVDHIVPHSVGGIDHPKNYFLLCGSINSSFSNWYTKEKEVYVGRKAMKSARDFAQWAKVKHQNETRYNDYDFERGVL